MPHADSSLLPSDVTTKQQLWAHIAEQLELLINGQRQWVSNLANASSLIYHTLASFPDFGSDDSAVNWAGFYLVTDIFPNSTSRDPPVLLLGPFAGRPACQFIVTQPPRGVCADAFLARHTILVPDVHSYPGHIACDGATNSEIVAPVFSADGQRVVGVLDLDCLRLGGFDEVDRAGVEKIVDLLGKACDW